MATSTHLITLENYCKILDKLLAIVSLPKTLLNSRLTFDEIVRDEVAEMLKGKCTDCEYFDDLTEEINRIEVKHANKNKKMSKQNIFCLKQLIWMILSGIYLYFTSILIIKQRAQKQILYDKIYPPLIKKDENIYPRSVYQLLEQYPETDQEIFYEKNPTSLSSALEAFNFQGRLDSNENLLSLFL